MTPITDLAEWRLLRDGLGGATVGFVPTMGALHEGHLALVRRSAADNDVTVVSVFVNATQFNSAADLEAYPQTLAEDVRLAAAAGADHVIAPAHASIYPDGYRYRVGEREVSTVLEGAHRPGHFDGVLTVVLKLLHLVRPHRAYFGEKDYQQLLLVRGMVEALLLPVEIVPCPTVRDADGLALSSRNVRLSPSARTQAAQLPAILAAARSPEEATRRLTEAGFEVDYVAEAWGRRLAAVVVDGVRLIDNLPLAVGEAARE
ncbi:MAG TPA: pantoate--beta-alanine ligase [Thermoanaerobaculales bacterium]|nr:pantoate--beta-alanine ligase [Thermoanaerobaculales bacterium]HQL29077.1 pantoate--beta-alanine ligase [Thermoanaerobaculales bacterium]